jgi:hypothetical protein
MAHIVQILNRLVWPWALLSVPIMCLVMAKRMRWSFLLKFWPITFSHLCFDTNTDENESEAAYLDYQSVCPIVGRGGSTLSCGWGGGGTQHGWRDRKPGSRYTLGWVRPTVSLRWQDLRLNTCTQNDWKVKISPLCMIVPLSGPPTEKNR